MIDLQQFCAGNDTRVWLRAPFSSGNYTFATDGVIMIRVPRVAGVPDITRPDYPARLTAIFAAFDGVDFAKPATFAIPDLPESWSDEKCEDCDGRGKEHDCPDCTCTCDECGGTGSIKIADKVSTQFRGAFYRLSYIRQMFALPGIEIETGYPTAQSPLRFRFLGGEGVLMLRRTKCARHVELSEAASA